MENEPIVMLFIWWKGLSYLDAAEEGAMYFDAPVGFLQPIGAQIERMMICLADRHNPELYTEHLLFIQAKLYLG